MANACSWKRGPQIGGGAFGTVNVGLNMETGVLFAVKSIECNQSTRRRIHVMGEEIQILQCLDSPFVVKCLGSSFSIENGKSMLNVYLEYMSGGSLTHLMKNFGGHLEEPVIRNYTRHILEGIQYLHSKEIVHGDIKGKNILVGNNVVKLSNFSAAKRVRGACTTGSPLTLKGTPLWMAPEVARQTEQGPPSDIWSLGCTVVEMATGKAPWSGIDGTNSFASLYHIGCTEKVPDLPSCLSEEGQDFLRKCFQRDPLMRWTAKELLQHPFITVKNCAIQDSKSKFDLPSHSDETASSISNSAPFLQSPLFTKLNTRQDEGNFQREVVPKVKDAISGKDSKCCISPLSPLPGQWIVVRSSKASSTSIPSAPE